MPRTSEAFELATGGGHMFICLSSGASPRYREDVLRALAMPTGAAVQFRYDLKHLAHAVQNAVHEKKAEGQPALIVYVKQPTPDAAASYVPCRYAKIKKVNQHGTTVSLLLTLEEYGYSENLANFGQWLTASGGVELPAWSDNKVQGKYWLLTDNDPISAVRSSSLANWERIVTQLAGIPDFAEERCFYAVGGIRGAGTDTSVAPTDGVYHLDGGKAYEMALYHYHPSQTPTDVRMEVKPVGDGIEFITNPVMQIDSRYDQKVVRFKLHASGFSKEAFLSLVRGSARTELLNWQFDLPIHIKGQFLRTLAFGVVAAALLAVAPIMTVWANPNIPKENAQTVTVLAVLSSLGAGLIAAFGLKKTF